MQHSTKECVACHPPEWMAIMLSRHGLMLRGSFSIDGHGERAVPSEVEYT
jgi:hypothetical protein